MIAVTNLSKDYLDDGSKTAALKNISFKIKRGEFVAIIGPSGSGKSTLLHILSFLDRPTSGTYKFLDKSIDELSDAELAKIRNQSMGFVFQSFNLLGRASVYQNVEMPLIYKNEPVGPALRQRLVTDAIKSVNLAEKTNVEASKLSGGQKQRVAIARALVNDPDVIFADEPTGNLDSASGAQIMEILAKLNQEGRTIILVTHETYTAEFADRIIKLKDGLIESDENVKNKRSSAGEFKK